MREMTVFNYSELNAEAQEKARDEFRNNREYYHESEWIKENFESELEEKGLPNDDVEFSLSHCQGDGVAFYGRVNTTAALLDKLSLTDDSRMFVEQAQGRGWTIDADVVRNSFGYRYAHWNTMEVDLYTDDAESIAEDLFEEELQNVDDDEFETALAHHTDLIEEAFREYEEALSDYIKGVSRELEAAGYEEFEYYDSDEYIAEELEANGYEYTEEGERV